MGTNTSPGVKDCKFDAIMQVFFCAKNLFCVWDARICHKYAVMDNIADLAHAMQQVTQWAPDSEGPTEDHLDQIIRASLSVQKTCVSSKGFNIWLPHRQGLHKEWIKEVVEPHLTCLLDLGFEGCHKSLVYLFTPDVIDPEVVWDDNEKADVQSRLPWWKNMPNRYNTPGHTALGKNIPNWTKNYFVNSGFMLLAAGLEARRLGYHVQYVTLEQISQFMYNHPKFGKNVQAEPYIMTTALNIGTKPLHAKMSTKRNRAYNMVTKERRSHIYKPDAVTDDVPMHYEWTDTLHNILDTRIYLGGKVDTRFRPKGWTKRDQDIHNKRLKHKVT